MWSGVAFECRGLDPVPLKPPRADINPTQRNLDVSCCNCEVNPFCCTAQRLPRERAAHNSCIRIAHWRLTSIRGRNEGLTDAATLSLSG